MVDAGVVPVGNFVLAGVPVPQDISERITNTRMTMGIDSVTEVSFDVEDPALHLLASGMFRVDSNKPVTFDYGGLQMAISAVEANGGVGGNGGLTIQARSRVIRGMKRLRGPHKMHGVSATQYIESELKSIGVTRFVGQPTAPRRQGIARDVPADNEVAEEGANYPSAFTTAQRLAQEEGYLFFEVGGFVFFGQPSWLMTRHTNTVAVQWNSGPDDRRPLVHPICRVSEDAPVLVEITLEMPWSRYSEFMPGKPMELKGVPGFDGQYLISSISLDLTRSSNMLVEARSAIDPIVNRSGNDGSFTERGTGKHKQIVDWARDAGWSGEHLQIAVAIALAESRGNVAAVSPPNGAGAGKAAGSRDHGLWQINDYYHQFDRALIYSGAYNAKIAYSIYKAAGNSFRPWSTFRLPAGSPIYKQWMEEARQSIETTQNVGGETAGDSAGIAGAGYVWPTTIRRITSGFGPRKGGVHKGIDIGVSIGTEVRSIAAGTVTRAGAASGYGKAVYVDHGDGVISEYGHLNRFAVSIGQRVLKGQKIAESGNTGQSSGPHLHLTIRVKGVAIDPLNVLPR